MTETPRDPFTPDPTPEPEPVEPVETPPPLTSRAQEPPSAYENAGEPEVAAAAAEPAEPVEPPHPAPTDEPPLSSPTPEESFSPGNAGDAEIAAQPEPSPEPDPVEVPAAEPVEVPATQPIEVPAPVEVPTPVAPAAAVDPGSPLPAPAVISEPEPEPALAPAEPPAPAPAPRRSWLPVTAVAIAVLLLAGATGWLGWQVRQGSVAEAGRPDAVAAARDAARLLFSYSHETLEEDFAKGLAVTTGEFRSEYSRTTKEVVTPVAEQYDAVVVAEVVEASLIDSGPGRATALVFLNQGTTSTRVKGQQVDQSRVRMQLVERDGRWLVRAVDAL